MPVTASGKNVRSFAVVNVGKHGGCKTKFHPGRYLSTTPVGAAKKAFNELCRVKKIRGVCTLYVSVKETTKGSKNKVFTYKLRRNKLKEPVVRHPAGLKKPFVIEYQVTAKAASGDHPCLRPGQSRGKPKKRTAKRQLNVRKLLSKKKN